MIESRKCVYLAYIHPKKGSEGSPNTTNEARGELYKMVTDAIKSDN